MIKLNNEYISIEVSKHGAELRSIKYNDKEYLWQADAKYWGRSAPILFPIVGQVWNGTYRVNGTPYKMSQHGFARDMDFEPISGKEGTFRLCSNEETLAKYPYSFELVATYALQGKQVQCVWTVKNTGDSTMYYQIGAHPGFYYRDFDENDAMHGMITVENLSKSAVKPIIRGVIEGGFRASRAKATKISCIMLLDNNTFAQDALLLEDGQTKIITLRDKKAKEYIRVTSDCQVYGIWSPTGKNAPFVCLEPWMGRCDSVGFEGDISEREFIQKLEPNQSQDFSYTIEILD